MSTLNELIHRLCPERVEYKKLGECIEIYTGKQFNKRDMFEIGSFPVINGGVNESGYSEKYNESANTITISQGGASAGYVNFMEIKFWAGAHCFIVKPLDITILNNRYLYFVLKNQEINLMQSKHGAGIPALKREEIKNLFIPLPPLPVQAEIVRILDRFTDLAAELQAELQARREQYEYYRNRLLSFEEAEVKWMKMSEVCEKIENMKWKLIDKTKNFEYIDLSSVDRDNSTIMETKLINKENAPSRAQQIIRYNDVLLGTTRPTLKRYCIIPQQYNNQICSTGFCVFRTNPKILLPKYLYFHLTTSMFYNFLENNQEGAGYPSISNSKLMNYLIPIPPLSKQERIVSILDRFEALTADLSQGLPAEIAAVQEQYEYYRNRLLSFPVKKRSA